MIFGLNCQDFERIVIDIFIHKMENAVVDVYLSYIQETKKMDRKKLEIVFVLANASGEHRVACVL